MAFSPYHLIILVVAVVPWLLTVLHVARRRDLSDVARVMWIAVATIAPFLGPIAYLLAGRAPGPRTPRP